MKMILTWFSRVLGLAFVEFWAVKLGLLMGIVHGNVSPVWPATGIGIAAIMVMGFRVWPGVALGYFLAILDTGVGYAVTGGEALAATLEAVIAARLVNRALDLNDLFGSVRNVLAYCLFAGLVATAVSATVGVGSLSLGGIVPWDGFAYHWGTWWLGDMMGALIVTPFLLTWAGVSRVRIDARLVPQVIWVFGLLIVTAGIAFWGPLVSATGVTDYPLAFLTLPIVVWAAMLFGECGSTAAVLIVSVMAIAGTAKGLGPFFRGSVNESLLLLQTYLGVVSVTSLILRSVISQRDRAELKIREARDELDQRVMERTTELMQTNEQLKREITERDRIEQALRESEQLLKNILSASPVGIGYVKERKLGWANDAMRKMFGFTSEADYLGKDASILYSSEEEFQRAGKIIYQGLKAGRQPETDAAFRRKDHTVFYGHVTLSPFDPSSPMKAAIAAVSDITARKRSEEELRSAKEAAETERRAKGEFLVKMSHEIRTPVTAIIGITELFLNTDLTAEQREYLHDVKMAGESLLTVVNEILDFARMEAGKLAIAAEHFNVRECVEECLSIASVGAHKKGLEIAGYVHPAIPEMVVGDPRRIRQILLNLVGNAVKFTESGEITVRVEPQPNPPGKICLGFTVSDAGIGIPADRIPSIFEEFEQVDESAWASERGTGLGLAICSRLVRMMGGEISVESELNVGSSFSFMICVEESDRFPEPHHADDLKDHRGSNVLIADGNHTSRLYLHDTLAKWGLNPTSVQNGQEAAEMIDRASERGKQFDLVIVDPWTSGLVGLQAAQHFTHHTALMATPIVVAGARNRRGMAGQVSELNRPIWLSKPFRLAELSSVLHRALAHAPESADQGLADKRKTPRTVQLNQPMRILVADDNTVNRKLTARILENMGHSVSLAEDGEEAVQAVAREPLDLVLMDVQMPRMDGIAATMAIRELEKHAGRHIPIVAMTAGTTDDDQAACLRAGMDGYLAKPIRVRELVEVLNKVTESPMSQDSDGDAAANGEPILDEAELRERAEGDESFVKEMAAIFLDSVPRHLERIRKAVGDKDAAALCKAAHALKGASATLAAPAVCNCAYALERMGRDGNLEKAEAVFDELQKEMERLRGVLSRY